MRGPIKKVTIYIRTSQFQLALEQSAGLSVSEDVLPVRGKKTKQLETREAASRDGEIPAKVVLTPV